MDAYTFLTDTLLNTEIGPTLKRSFEGANPQNQVPIERQPWLSRTILYPLAKAGARDDLEHSNNKF